MPVEQKLIGLSTELVRVLDEIGYRTKTPRGFLVEDLLWQTNGVKQQAKKLRVKRPDRNTRSKR